MEQPLFSEDPDLLEVLDLIGAMETPMQAFLDYLRGSRPWPPPASLSCDPPRPEITGEGGRTPCPPGFSRGGQIVEADTNPVPHAAT